MTLPVPTELLSVYTVVAENSDYDEYDEWCVLASSEAQALHLVREHRTCLPSYDLEVTETKPLEAGVAYASFHPG